MNLEIKDLSQKLTPVLVILKKYKTLLFIVLVASIFAFLILRINAYAQTEPSEDAITEKLTTVSRPKVDEDALEKIQQLQDQNIEVKSLFEQARNNPFSE